MAWGAPFNGETSLRLMAEQLQRKKTSEQSPAPKRLRFPISKAAFSLVLGILVIFQSSPWLKCNWILAFPRHFQASPWILIFAIWTPIKPQTLVFLQLSP